MSMNTGPRSRKGVDDGFCLVYFSLSYRRKFIRTLWTFLFMPLILLVDLPHRYAWFLAAIGFGVCQAAYNYSKWKAEDRE